MCEQGVVIAGVGETHGRSLAPARGVRAFGVARFACRCLPGWSRPVRSRIAAVGRGGPGTLVATDRNVVCAVDVERAGFDGAGDVRRDTFAGSIEEGFDVFEFHEVAVTDDA